MEYLVLAIPFVYWVWVMGARKADRERIEKARQSVQGLISGLEGFTATRTYIAPDGSAGLAIDRTTRCVAIVEGGHVAKFAPEDVLSSEIVEDGTSVTRTSRGSQVLGAVVGGALLGGAGAVVGGLSASSTTSERVHRVELSVTVNDIARPVRTVSLLLESRGISTRERAYLTARSEANEWHALFSRVIQAV